VAVGNTKLAKKFSKFLAILVYLTTPSPKVLQCLLSQYLSGYKTLRTQKVRGFISIDIIKMGFSIEMAAQLTWLTAEEIKKYFAQRA
jgi:hypothetical protein